MAFPITESWIRRVCGASHYEDGAAMRRSGTVAFTTYNPNDSVYEASVSGTRSADIAVRIDRHGMLEAACSNCGPLSAERACAHVAMVLLAVRDRRNREGEAMGRSYADLLLTDEEREAKRENLIAGTGRASDADDEEDGKLALRLMGLFGDKPRPPSGARPHFDTRTRLNAAFILRPVAVGKDKLLLGIELKLGPERLYVVQKLSQFLDRVEHGEPYSFSRSFTYDPDLHSFPVEQNAVIQGLIRISRTEQLYDDQASALRRTASRRAGDRLLVIPPNSWDGLFALLRAVPSVQFEHASGTVNGMEPSKERLPLQFTFDQKDGGLYKLAIQGLDRLTILRGYKCVLADERLFQLPEDACERLAELDKLLDTSGEAMIPIPKEQMASFLETVVPAFRKLGTVTISKIVTEQIVQIPLKAKLYLDRVRDRLLAGLEFHYGGLVINPLEESANHAAGEHLLVRETEREQEILELMVQGKFAMTESGYYLDDEGEQFDFLYRIVPRLQPLLAVYATTAVKEKVFVGHAPPRMRVDVGERTDWLDIRFDLDGIPESEIRNLLRALEQKRPYYRLPGGALVPLEGEELQAMIRWMNEAGVRAGDWNGAEASLPVLQGIARLHAVELPESVKLGRTFRSLLDDMRHPERLTWQGDSPLGHVLRDYQKDGFQWMRTLARYRFGGILADDMGLGKTVQSIAFLASVLPEMRSSRLSSLIVAPASLLYNWRNELKSFAPDIRVEIADGTRRARGRLLAGDNEADVIITSYPLLRQDVELYGERSFHTLILDEAQAFKTYSTQTAQAVKKLRASHRFALTGTPIENAMEELWSIFDAVLPGLFPDRQAFLELSRESIRRRIRPFLLRRLKQDVLTELPDKIETLQAAELLPEQKKLYAAYLAKLRKDTLKHLDNETFGKNKIRILAGLTRLRQLCCHPALFVEGYAGRSAKFEQLLELLDECRSAGRRVLVFSQFTEMLGLIGRELSAQGIPYFYLDGSTPSRERVELVDRFNTGERELFLVSLKAGGTGLNLTGADTVILYDLWWNPAVEQQAEDRAHRIGQKQVVQVIRLVAQGTVEDKMYELQQRKKSMIDDVIQPGGQPLTSLTEEDILHLLAAE